MTIAELPRKFVKQYRVRDCEYWGITDPIEHRIREGFALSVVATVKGRVWTSVLEESWYEIAERTQRELQR